VFVIYIYRITENDFEQHRYIYIFAGKIKKQCQFCCPTFYFVPLSQHQIYCCTFFVNYRATGETTDPYMH